MPSDAVPIADAVTGELVEPGALATVPVRADLLSAAPVADVVALQRSYQELCEALLDDSDYQHIGGRLFRKKTAWRKLAVAFTCRVRSSSAATSATTRGASSGPSS